MKIPSTIHHLEIEDPKKGVGKGKKIKKLKFIFHKKKSNFTDSIGGYILIFQVNYDILELMIVLTLIKLQISSTKRVVKFSKTFNLLI